MTTLHLDELRQYSDILRLALAASPLTVRFLEPQDAGSLQTYFRSLTASSRFNRFLGAISELPQTLLEHFIHVGEGERFSVIVTMTVDGIDTIVGEARYAFDAVAGSFEFGLSIADRGRARASVQRCSATCNAARQLSAPRTCSAILCAPTGP